MLGYGFTLTLVLSHQGRGDSVGCFVLLSPSLPCQALGQALVLSRQGRGDSVGCVGLLSARPCGYCLEASMTDLAVGLSFFTRVAHRPSGLRIKSAMTGSSCLADPALWIPAYAGMTGPAAPRSVDTALKPV